MDASIAKVKLSRFNLISAPVFLYCESLSHNGQLNSYLSFLAHDMLRRCSIFDLGRLGTRMSACFRLRESNHLKSYRASTYLKAAKQGKGEQSEENLLKVR